MQSARRDVLPGLILVLVGLLLLVGNMVRLAPWVFVTGFGIVLLVAYFSTRRFGLLIAGCLLTTIGAYVSFADQLASDSLRSAAFFGILGLAFVAIYVLRGLWQIRWPLIVATILLAIGLAMALASSLFLIDPEDWYRLAQWWPAILILFGLWLLAARRLGPTLRLVTGIALGLLSALFLVGAVAIGSSASAGAVPGWFALSRGAEATETVERTAQLPVGGSLVVTNSSGSTTIHGGALGDVKVVATKHSWAASEEQARKNLSAVLLKVDEGASSVEVNWVRANPVTWFSGPAGVDYDIAVPSGASIEVKSSSGRVLVREVDSSVKVRVSSGSAELVQIGGAANVIVSSGEARLQNVGGQVDVEASSGRIVAQGIRDSFRLETRSGSVDLSGYIRKGGEIKTSSGDVRLSPDDESAFFLNAVTRSGNISADPRHKVERPRKSELTATVGAGGPTVNVRVTSGNITLK